VAATKKKTSRKRAALSSKDRAATEAYVEILRWLTDTFDRLERSVEQTGLQASAARALQAIGSYEPLAAWAEEHNIQPPPGSGSAYGDALAARLFPEHKPYTEVVLYFKRAHRDAETARDSFARRLKKCHESDRGPIALFAAAHGMNIDTALSMSAAAISLERQGDARLGVPDDPDVLLDERNRWMAWAVPHVERLILSPRDETLIEQASVSVYYAQRHSRSLRGERTVAKQLEEHRRGSNDEQDRARVRAETLALLTHQDVREARAGTARNKRGGVRNAATQLVALACGVSARTIEEAVAARTKVGLAGILNLP